MPAYSPTIPVRYTALLWECMESLDTDRDAVLSAAGLGADFSITRTPR